MAAHSDIPVLLERIGRVLQAYGHSEGMKPTQWEALRYFARANRFSRTPSALTAYLGMTKGTVSQTISVLERKGLIAKAADAQDRRHVQIDVTARGARMLRRDPLENMTASLSRLSARKREALRDDLSDILRQALKERGGRAFGACRTCRYFEKNSAGGAPHRCALLDEPLSALDSEHICVEHEFAA